MDRIQKAGHQIDWLAYREPAHILQGKPGFRAARPGSIEHRLVDIQTAAHIAHIKQVPHMRSGATGQIQMALATVAQQLLQAMNALALRLVVDFGTHQIVVTGKVGIDGVDGHESLGLK